MIVRLFLIAQLIVSLVPVSFAQDAYPAPVSEYVEQTGPTTMTFLSYPKYYRDAEGQLAEVDTTLRPSGDPEWDYEVTAGIWTLRVRKDGTYQAEHAGDVFTYRFADLGIGRGADFASLNLGEPDFSRFSVMGDRIRWSDVLPDIDLEVRYIHDILKVDVIVKQDLLNSIRGKVLQSEYAPQEYVTAKFDMPQALVRSQAMQAGQPRDLYAEAFDVSQPVEFVREGRGLHMMRPVESYFLDQDGQRVFMKENGEELTVRGAQALTFKQDAPGLAEVSTRLGDIADAPFDTLVIDPSFTFDYTHGVSDTRLQYNSSTIHGSASTLYFSMGGPLSTSDRLLFGFDTSSKAADLAGSVVSKATLKLRQTAISIPYSNEPILAFAEYEDWQENYANWTQRNSGVNWYEAGGMYNASFASRSKTLPTSANQDVEIDVTNSFKKHMVTNLAETDSKGFVLRYLSSQYIAATFASSEYATVAYRPKLTVEYGATQFGVDPGTGSDSASNGTVANRLTSVQDDKLNVLRYFVHELSINDVINMVDEAKQKGMKVILVFAVGNDDYFTVDSDSDSVSDELNYVPGSTCERCWWNLDGGIHKGHATQALDFAAYVMYRLNQVENGISGTVLGDTVIAIEIGNEEEGKWLDNTLPDVDPDFWTGLYNQGQFYAEFYYQSAKQIRTSWPDLEIIGGGSPYWHPGLEWIHVTLGSVGDFIEGFIDEVKSLSTSDGLGEMDIMPDTFAIHGYQGPDSQLLESPVGNGYPSPEYFDKAHLQVPRTEWRERLTELANLFEAEGYLPNFSQTEYGFSPDSDHHYSPHNGGSEIRQAVYYLRHSLLTATMRAEKSGGGWRDGIGFRHTMYWNHPENDSLLDDVCFKDTSGNLRIISDFARFMHSPTGNLRLGVAGSSVWVPAQSSKPTGPQSPPNIFPYSNDGYSWCGWETDASDYWGAIWRYNYTSYYHQASPQTSVFKVDGDFSLYDAYLYEIKENSNGDWVLSSLQQNVSGTYNAGVTSYSIPSVTDMPRIIHFQK